MKKLVNSVFSYFNSHPKALFRLKLWNLFSFIVLVVINVLGTLGKIGIGTNASISEKYDLPITPAGYTFSVWGFIWAFQAAFVLYSFVSVDKTKDPYIISSLFISLLWHAEAFWTFPFNYDIQWLAMIFFILNLGTAWLWFVFYRVAVADLDTSTLSIWKKIGYYCIFSLHLGANVAWICCAFVIQVFILLKSEGVVVENGVYIAVLVIIAVVGLAVVGVTGDLPFAFTVVWAFVGIYNRTTQSQIKTTLLVLAIAEAVVAVILFVVRRFAKPKKYQVVTQSYY
jgi:benzodiazapine receptor